MGWSEELKERTRDALSGLDIIPFDGKVHLKHCDKWYGYILLEDLLDRKYNIYLKSSFEKILYFNNLEEMIQQGWVVD